MGTKLFDSGCYDLATSFLADSRPPNGKTTADSLKDAEDLAGEIQELIETFMNDRGYQ